MPELLMENAGAALASECSRMASELGLDRIVLYVGPGNNGGDALVAGRHLAGSGARIELRAPLGRPDPDPRRLELERAAGRFPGTLASADPLAPVPGSALVVDGLFGVGLARPLQGAARSAVEHIRASGAPVLAVDLPSGLDADEGRVLGAAPRAARTLTFVAPKRGLLLGRGPELAGEVRVAGIGVSAEYAAAWLRERRSAATG